MRKVTVKLDDGLAERLDAAARAEQKSVSELVRELLDDALFSRAVEPYGGRVAEIMRSSLASWTEQADAVAAYRCDDVLDSLSDELDTRLRDIACFAQAAAMLAAEAADPDDPQGALDDAMGALDGEGA